MSACICGDKNIVWYPASSKYRKWYCPKCGVVCRLARNLDLELAAMREREAKLTLTNPVLPDCFKPWKVLGNGVQMGAHRDEKAANTQRDQLRNRYPECDYWTEYQITADDAGLPDEHDPETPPH